MLAEIEACRGTRKRVRSIQVPEVRPSILDPALESDPWIDCCPCSDTLALFVHNRPVALFPGSSLECISLNIRLNQLRHRNPRQ